MKCGCDAGKVKKGRQIVFTDPKSVFLEGGPTLGVFEGLQPSLKQVKYVSRAVSIFSPAVRKRLRKGDIKDTITPSFTPDFSKLQGDSSLGTSLISPFSAPSFERANIGKPYVVILEV